MCCKCPPVVECGTEYLALCSIGLTPISKQLRLNYQIGWRGEPTWVCSSESIIPHLPLDRKPDPTLSINLLQMSWKIALYCNRWAIKYGSQSVLRCWYCLRPLISNWFQSEPSIKVVASKCWVLLDPPVVYPLNFMLIGYLLNSTRNIYCYGLNNSAWYISTPWPRIRLNYTFQLRYLDSKTDTIQIPSEDIESYTIKLRSYTL